MISWKERLGNDLFLCQVGCEALTQAFCSDCISQCVDLSYFALNNNTWIPCPLLGLRGGWGAGSPNIVHSLWIPLQANEKQEST